MLEINGFAYINSSEAIYGNMIFKNNKLIIPYFNVNIMDNNTEYLKELKGSYLKYCYLLFENISGIIWDYDLSRFLPFEKRECYGGVNFYDKKYNEFWISYEKGTLLLNKDFETSKHPWNNEICDADFFNISSEIINKL